MLVDERHQSIVAVVNERGSIRVTELSEIFRVTEETIRRDLDKLERKGLLRRSHGGAIREENKTHNQEIMYSEREVVNIEEKREIARLALSYIEPHDRIILDASSTAWYMAKVLPNIRMTVLTNSIKVSMELAAKDNIQVISTGGLVSARSLSYVGPLAERSMEAYHVNKAFLSCKGIHAQYGISESNELQGLVKQKMIAIADTIFMLVDHTKFGVQSFTHVRPMDDVDYIITDKQTRPEQTRPFARPDLKIIQSV